MHKKKRLISDSVAERSHDNAIIHSVLPTTRRHGQGTNACKWRSAQWGGLCTPYLACIRQGLSERQTERKRVCVRGRGREQCEGTVTARQRGREGQREGPACRRRDVYYYEYSNYRPIQPSSFLVKCIGSMY